MSAPSLPTLLRTRPASWAGTLATAVLVVVLVPVVVQSAALLSLLTSVLVFGLAATSLAVVWGQVGQVSLAHASLFGIGAYAVMITHRDWGLDFGWAMAAATMVGALAGLLVGLPLLRLTGHYFAILTFAVAMVIETLKVRLFRFTGGFAGISLSSDAFDYMGLDLKDRVTLFRVAAVVVLATLLVLTWIIRGRWGDRFHATRENPLLAQAIGIDVKRERLVAFTLSGAVAGIAGGLYSFQVRVIAPDLFGSMIGIALIAVVLLGGTRQLFGGLVGAGVYYLLPHYFSLDPLHNQILFGVLLLVLVIAMPEGLLTGVPTRLRRLWDRRSGARGPEAAR